jgi:16S rRNA (cytosine967-C5)-methyltransferase
MLANAAAVVAPGGRLIYATCSSEPEENMQVVHEFLAASDLFALSLAHEPDVPATVINPDGCLQTTPFEHGLDAFFAAALVRRAGA